MAIKDREVIGGYWKIDVKSKEEAVEWAKRVLAEDVRYYPCPALVSREKNQ